MSCDAQTLATLAATNKVAALSRRGLAEAIAAQSAQHSTGPAFIWAPGSASVIWTDKNGSFSGNLATFNATADLPSVAAVNFSASSVTSVVGFSLLPILSDLTLNNNPGLAAVTVDSTTLNFQVTVLNNATLASLSFPQLTGTAAGAGITISGNASMATLSLPALSLLGSVLTISGNPLITALSFPSLGRVGDVGITINNNASLTFLSVRAGCRVGDPVLGASAFCDTNPALTSVDFSGMIFLLAGTGSTTIDFTGCALNQASIDALLAIAIANGFANGDTVSLGGGTNSTPSAAGAADAATLTGNGCNVTTN